MEAKNFSSWILGALFMIIGGISGQIIEQYFGHVFDPKTLPHQILIISSVFIIFLIVFVVYLQRIDRKVENALAKLIKPFLDEIPCSFLSNEKERLEKMKEYINLSKKQIYIYSSLKKKMETELKEHKNYLNALNQKLKNTDIKFQRIIVPHFDISGMNDEDIKTKIKDQDDYKKHFGEIFENRRNTEALIVDKNGSEGISIMILDEKYLFLNIKKSYKNLKLKNILDGGFFFEDIGSTLTHRFKEFFDGKKDLIVID